MQFELETRRGTVTSYSILSCVRITLSVEVCLVIHGNIIVTLYCSYSFMKVCLSFMYLIIGGIIFMQLLNS